MPRYISCLDITNVALGEGSGSQISTGTDNVLLGAQAGANITTGTGNIILGAAPGLPDASDTITVSSAVTGDVRAKWGPTGDVQLRLRSANDVPDPEPGFVTLGHDPVRRLVVLRHHDGTGVSTSQFRTDDDIRSVVPLGVDSSGRSGSVSLVRDAGTRTLKRLAPGTNLTLETPVEGDCVVLHGPETALNNASGTGVSLVANASLRQLRTLREGTNIQLDASRGGLRGRPPVRRPPAARCPSTVWPPPPWTGCPTPWPPPRRWPSAQTPPPPRRPARSQWATTPCGTRRGGPATSRWAPTVWRTPPVDRTWPWG